MVQLKSESAVLKSTVYTEFMSEWLQPWVGPPVFSNENR
jgi:hypothetical protein